MVLKEGGEKRRKTRFGQGLNRQELGLQGRQEREAHVEVETVYKHNSKIIICIKIN